MVPITFVQKMMTFTCKERGRMHFSKKIMHLSYTKSKDVLKLKNLPHWTLNVLAQKKSIDGVILSNYLSEY